MPLALTALDLPSIRAIPSTVNPQSHFFTLSNTIKAATIVNHVYCTAGDEVLELIEELVELELPNLITPPPPLLCHHLCSFNSSVMDSNYLLQADPTNVAMSIRIIAIRTPHHSFLMTININSGRISTQPNLRFSPLCAIHPLPMRPSTRPCPSFHLRGGLATIRRLRRLHSSRPF